MKGLGPYSVYRSKMSDYVKELVSLHRSCVRSSTQTIAYFTIELRVSQKWLQSIF